MLKKYYLLLAGIFLIGFVSAQINIGSNVSNSKIINIQSPPVTSSSGGGNVTSVSSSTNCITVNSTTTDVILTFNSSCASAGGGDFSFSDFQASFNLNFTGLNNSLSVNNSNCWKGDCGGFRAQVNQNVNSSGTPTFAAETLNQAGLGTWLTFSFIGTPIGIITSALGAFQFQAQNNFDYYLTNDDLSAIIAIKDNGQITATGTNFQVPTVADFNVSRTSIYNNFTLSGIADFNKSRVSIYNNMTVTGYINATRDVCVTNGNCLNKTIAPVNTPYKNNTITYWNNNTRVWDVLQGSSNDGYLAQCSGALMWLNIGAVCPI